MWNEKVFAAHTYTEAHRMDREAEIRFYHLPFSTTVDAATRYNV